MASSSRDTPETCCCRLLACATSVDCAVADVLALFTALPTAEVSEAKYCVNPWPLMGPGLLESKPASVRAVPLTEAGGPGLAAASWLGVMVELTARDCAMPVGELEL